MESTEEEFSSFTTKGRRTKRQRSLLAASASSSYRGGGGGGGVVVVGGVGCSDNSYGFSSSGASPSDDHDIMSEVTTEEEDMANCLILLAQGIQKEIQKEKKSCCINIKSKTQNNNNNNNKNNKNNNNSSNSITSNIIGVYECKTCNKTFGSFQALGGHRTSHKKIKPASATTTIATTTTTTALRPSQDLKNNDHDRIRHDHVDDDLDGIMEFTSKKFLVQTQNDNNNNNNNNKARVHECSICGSEFPSGQALGGHMRRHRTASATPSTMNIITTSSTVAATTTTTTTTTTVIDTGGPRNILSLDLNLPAPDEQDDQQLDVVDNHMETNFVHVLPTPAPLVDCHY